MAGNARLKRAGTAWRGCSALAYSSLVAINVYDRPSEAVGTEYKA